MKKGIHPEIYDLTVRCVCGNSFETTSTVKKIEADICSACHPFFTGKQKFIDTAGRIDRFQQRYAKAEKKPVAKPKAKAKTETKVEAKVEAKPKETKTKAAAKTKK
jgi:large subunit ribosomal protein L31